MKSTDFLRGTVAVWAALMSVTVWADDGLELSLKAGEKRAYRMKIDETSTSAGGGVNVKNDYPTTLEFSLTTGEPTEKELTPVTLQVTRYQAKLPQIDTDFVERVYEFDSATWQRETKISNQYFLFYAAHLGAPLKLMFDKSGDLVEVQGSEGLTKEYERLLARDFADHPVYPNALQAGRLRCHKDTLKRLWDQLLTLKLPEDFEPEKPWDTKVVFTLSSGGYVGWLQGKHSAIEAEDDGFTITSEYEFPRTGKSVQKNASGSENEYFIKSGTGKGTILRGADGWAKKHTRELHVYVSITLRFSGAEIPSERYSKYIYTIEQLPPQP